IGSDGVYVDAGLAYALGPSSDLSVRYIGQFLEDYDSNSVMGRFTWKFGAAPAAAPAPRYVPLKLGGEDCTNAVTFQCGLIKNVRCWHLADSLSWLPTCPLLGGKPTLD